MVLLIALVHHVLSVPRLTFRSSAISCAPWYLEHSQEHLCEA
jgi:hypothetical protein